jgi:Sec-independent protein translocase protein TatA
LFGRKLPDVGRGIGQGIREFKKGLKDVEDDVKREEPASRKSLPGEQVAQTPEGTQSRAEQR